MAVATRYPTFAAAAACACALALAGCTPSPPSVPIATHRAGETATCPARPLSTLAPSTLSGAGSQLIPITPTGVLVCHYGALTSESLLSSTVVYSAKDAAELASFLDHAGQYVTGAINCPNDDGESVDFTFWSRTASSELTVGLSGCRIASNGTTYRLGVDLPPDLRKLAGLPAEH